ncbi:MAG: ribokinase [Phycisphaerales bacterium]|nr:ribokinase [Phycisphaerales bacterium]
MVRKASKPHIAKPAVRKTSPVSKHSPKPPSLPPPSQSKFEAIPSTGPGRTSNAGPKSGVVVIGSLNMDLVLRTEVMPTPGQTVMGQNLQQNPGGKGANQAIAAGQLWSKRSPPPGGGARLVGRIGEDIFGANLLAALNEAKVDTTSVLKTRGIPSGAAMIVVDRHGENAIVVAGGANRHLAATDLLAQRKAIETSVVLIAQLEIPHDTVACAFALAKRSGVLTILDPAPAPTEGLPESLYHVDILTPNQTEAEILTGMPVRNMDDARRAAERFLLCGTRIVVMKMGSQGAAIIQKNTHNQTIAQHIPGYRVPVIDTTAAGDAFTGALAVALAEGRDLPSSVRFANAAGALTCTKQGAAPAIPTRAQVEKFIAERA